MFPSRSRALRHLIELKKLRSRSASGHVFRRCYHGKRGVLQELRSRGMVSQMTSQLQQAGELNGPKTLYLGVDPTAEALHVGHLLPFMSSLHFFLYGHRVLALIGGATGLVGDPSGKMEERTPLGEQRAASNVSKLEASIQRFFESAREYASRKQLVSQSIQSPKTLNNVDWLGSLGLLEFLTKAGRHARVPTMINRDSVRIRMSSQQGISFTEFTYQLLQAYDYYHLYHNHECTLQIGGSDQWGNILAGTDLIDRTRPPEKESAQGLTTPLLTTASGAKFGKSEGNAVWLDPSLTSVFDFYQFFVRTADADVEVYLKYFTLLDLEEIGSIVTEHQANPERRIAQHALAAEVTELVHGTEGVQKAHVATQTLFGTDYKDLRAKDIISALDGDPRLVFCAREQLLEQRVTKIAAAFKLVPSSKEAQRLAAANGLYINSKPCAVSQTLLQTDLIDEIVVVLRAGKDKHLVLAIQ